jgi:hypothetical protein
LTEEAEHRTKLIAFSNYKKEANDLNDRNHCPGASPQIPLAQSGLRIAETNRKPTYHEKFNERFTDHQHATCELY